MNLPSVLIWGAVATAVLTSFESGGQRLGLTRMSIPTLLGTMLTPNRDRAVFYGLIAHFAVGLAIAFFYAAVFELLGRATWWIGAALAVVHATFILGTVMPVLPAVHPRMATERDGPTPTRNLQPPGFMALNYGRRSAIVELAGHVLYGAILGAFYTL